MRYVHPIEGEVLGKYELALIDAFVRFGVYVADATMEEH